MSISKTKNRTLSIKTGYIYLASMLIVSPALLTLNTYTATTLSISNYNLNKGFQCSYNNPCDSTLHSQSGHAYSITFGDCVRTDSDRANCISDIPWGTINVICGTSNIFTLDSIGDNILCNTNEDVHFFSEIPQNGGNLLVSVHLLPVEKSPWGVAIIGGAIGSICLATTVAAIAFIIHECKKHAGNNQNPLLEASSINI